MYWIKKATKITWNWVIFGILKKLSPKCIKRIGGRNTSKASIAFVMIANAFIVRAIFKYVHNYFTIKIAIIQICEGFCKHLLTSF